MERERVEGERMTIVYIQLKRWNLGYDACINLYASQHVHVYQLLLIFQTTHNIYI